MRVRVSAHQNVAIELTLNGGESLHISPRNDLVSMDNTNLEVVDLDDLGLWQGCDLIAIAFHDVRLAFRGSQVL